MIRFYSPGSTVVCPASVVTIAGAVVAVEVVTTVDSEDAGFVDACCVVTVVVWVDCSGWVVG